jgi:hypothetical protein
MRGDPHPTNPDLIYEPIYEDRRKSRTFFYDIRRVALHNVSGLCYITYMNTLDEIKTQVFCSQCDFVTSNFIEWAGEFYCEEECVAYLPTEASMEEQDFGNPDAEWLASAGFGDDEDYGAW